MLDHLAVSLSGAVKAAADTTLETVSSGENLIFGLSVTALGLVVVFIGLVSLIFITLLYPKIVSALISKSAAIKASKVAKKQKKTSDKKQKPATKPEATAIQTTKQDNVDHGIIAAITAAIAASIGTTNGVMIRSLKRSRSNTPAWGKEGRSEQIYNRF
ncbi:MAG: OadG family protein [Christensenellales bacterium]|jgi:Na+-transporting methylmalonyl-CoA/oxaloacetate decarboxylase gamma subunit